MRPSLHDMIRGVIEDASQKMRGEPMPEESYEDEAAVSPDAEFIEKLASSVDFIAENLGAVEEPSALDRIRAKVKHATALPVSVSMGGENPVVHDKPKGPNAATESTHTPVTAQGQIATNEKKKPGGANYPDKGVFKTAESDCPKCKVALEGGKCGHCGYVMEKTAANRVLQHIIDKGVAIRNPSSHFGKVLPVQLLGFQKGGNPPSFRSPFFNKSQRDVLKGTPYARTGQTRAADALSGREGRIAQAQRLRRDPYYDRSQSQRLTDDLASLRKKVQSPEAKSDLFKTATSIPKLPPFKSSVKPGLGPKTQDAFQRMREAVSSQTSALKARTTSAKKPIAHSATSADPMDLPSRTKTAAARIREVVLAKLAGEDVIEKLALSPAAMRAAAGKPSMADKIRYSSGSSRAAPSKGRDVNPASAARSPEVSAAATEAPASKSSPATTASAKGSSSAVSRGGKALRYGAGAAGVVGAAYLLRRALKKHKKNKELAKMAGEDVVKAQISAAREANPGSLLTYTANDPAPNHSGGGNEARKLIQSNRAAIGFKPKDAVAPQKAQMKQVLDEPMMSAQHDSTLRTHLQNADKAGVKIAAVQSFLRKKASEALTNGDHQKVAGEQEDVAMQMLIDSFDAAKAPPARF